MVWSNVEQCVYIYGAGEIFSISITHFNLHNSCVVIKFTSDKNRTGEYSFNVFGKSLWGDNDLVRFGQDIVSIRMANVIVELFLTPIWNWFRWAYSSISVKLEIFIHLHLHLQYMFLFQYWFWYFMKEANTTPVIQSVAYIFIWLLINFQLKLLNTYKKRRIF